MSASVKIMRSYDYCHFEVCLGTEDNISLDDVDKMRKEAMRLVDKAVLQYQTAKRIRDFAVSNDWDYRQLQKRAQEIKANSPESEWTPEQKAMVKDYENMTFRMNLAYDYEDNWEW